MDRDEYAKMIDEVETDYSKNHFDRFIEGAIFLRKLGAGGVSAEHDEICFYGLDIVDVSEDDAKKLRILGFMFYEEYNGFVIFV